MIKSIFESLGNIFRKPLTSNYPKIPIHRAKNYRGLIKYTQEYCIFCDICEKVCPADSIIFTQNLDGSKLYHYNSHLCIYCGECVKDCPKDEALEQSDEKPTIALKEDDINNTWRILQNEAKQSRINYKNRKKEKVE